MELEYNALKERQLNLMNSVEKIRFPVKPERTSISLFTKPFKTKFCTLDYCCTSECC